MMEEKSEAEGGDRSEETKKPEFITPNEQYYRNKNIGFGWSILRETPTEITWGKVSEMIDIEKEARKLENEYWKFIELKKDKKGSICAIYRNVRTGEETTTDFSVKIKK